MLTCTNIHTGSKYAIAIFTLAVIEVAYADVAT